MIFKLKLSLLFCLLIICAGFSAKGQGKVTLSGTIMNPKGDMVFLNRLESGPEGKKVGSAKLDEKGSFTMSITLKQPARVNFQHGDEETPMYLIPGDKLHITLDATQFDETVKYTGRGAVINNYLAQKLLHDEVGQSKRATAAWEEEAEFIRFTDSTLAVNQNFLTTFFKQHALTKAEAAFVEKAKTDLLYRWAHERANYPGMHTYYRKLETTYQPTPQYFDYLKKVQLDNPAALDSKEYLFFTQALIRYEANKRYKKNEDGTGPNYIGLVLEAIDDTFAPGKVKTMQIKEVLENVRNEEDFKVVEPLMPKFRAEAAKWPELKAELESVYSKKLALRPGKPAPNFTATTPDGKKISLSDYKGKVVYVDIWASWCGPCVAEIPHAKKLMEEFKDKEVVFLNISIDQSEDSWKKALERHGVHGVNALAEGAFSSEIARDYQVNGIPQYLLVGKDGNLITSYAFRPSGKAKQQIQAALEAGN